MSKKNPDGTTTWYIDPHRAALASLLGDDFDYSELSNEELEELVEKMREADEESKPKPKRKGRGKGPASA